MARASAFGACELTGNYRLRFSSNGADGWWLRLRVDGTPPKAEVVARADMLGLSPGPIQLAADPNTCKLVLTRSTEHAGDVQISLAVAQQTGVVTGKVTRSKIVAEHDSQVPISGVREIGPIQSPDCLRPGVFKLMPDPKAKWTISEGSPLPGDALGCKGYLKHASAVVRIEPLGDQIFVDEVGGGYEQSFGRAEVKRLDKCKLALHIGFQDFDFEAKLSLAGDMLVGTTPKATYRIFNDGDAGENLWACSTKNLAIKGVRIAD